MRRRRVVSSRSTIKPWEPRPGQSSAVGQKPSFTQQLPLISVETSRFSPLLSRLRRCSDRILLTVKVVQV
jgi:hypothetical protein